MTKSIAEQYAEDLTKKSARRIAQEQLAGKTYSAHSKPYVFGVEKGQKYDRITQMSGHGGGLSVHAFVERATGDLIKAAGWKAPAKDKNGKPMARYNLATLAGYRHALHNADDHGSYLYADFPQTNPPADDHGNFVAHGGVDRCVCGNKYWEKDTCTDCGMHITKAVEIIEEA